MSIFYLLPPRAVVGQRLMATLGIATAPASAHFELAETLGKLIEATGAFAVYRDELPPHEESGRALADGFGAEAGDEVIEIGPNLAPRHWRILRGEC